MRKLFSFLRNISGAAAIEYGLFAALISVAIMGTLFRVGDSVADPITKIWCYLAGISCTPPG